MSKCLCADRSYCEHKGWNLVLKVAAFLSYPETGPNGIALGSVPNRETFTTSRALHVPRIKEKAVLTVPAAGTHLGGTNLDFQMEQFIYKRKSDSIYIIKLQRTWEKLLPQAAAIIAIENLAGVMPYPPGIQLCWSLCCLWSCSYCWRSTPRTFTNQLQAASQGPRPTSGGYWSQGRPPALSQVMLTCLPSLWVKQTLLCAVWTLPSRAWEGTSLSGCDVLEAGREVRRLRGSSTPARQFDACVTPSPVSTCGRSQLLYVYRDPEEMEKDEQGAPEKVLALEEIQGIWTAAALEFTAPQPAVADRSEGTGALAAFSSVPAEQEPSPPRRGLGQWLPPLRPLNR